MLRLALRGQAKPLFGSLMCLLLWHFSGPMLANIRFAAVKPATVSRFGKPCSIEDSVVFERGTSAPLAPSPGRLQRPKKRLIRQSPQNR
jgi:hypothetical protein